MNRRTDLAARTPFAIALTLFSTGLLGVGSTFLEVGPLLVIAVLAVIALVLAPSRVGVACIGLLAVLGPVANPVVAGSGESGRVYLSSVLCIAIFIAGLLGREASPKMRARAAAIAAATVLLVMLLSDFGRQLDLPWIYRPLQLALVAIGVACLVRDHATAMRVYIVGLAAALVGVALGVLHFFVPMVDPFVLTRPTDLMWESTAAGLVRATGAFVYPNNFGMFCVYVAVVGLGELVERRIRTPFATALFVVGLLGVLTSLSRAAVLALLVGMVVMIAARLRHLGAAAIWMLLLAAPIGVLATYSATVRHAVADRASDAVGHSLELRASSTAVGWEWFKSAPVGGVGVQPSTLDNGILLYLGTGGLIGCLLLLVIFALATRRPPGARRTFLPPALWLAVLAASVVQDVIGQTLSTWFLGLMFGVQLALGNSSSIDGVEQPKTAPPRRRTDGAVEGGARVSGNTL